MPYQNGFKEGCTGLDPLAALRQPVTSLQKLVPRLGESTQRRTSRGDHSWPSPKT